MLPNLSLSLDQLENTDWGEPTYSSYLVRTCHALRKKPLQDFIIEDLRIMIGQNISLEHLMPLAIVELSKNILAEGDFYEGDLLKAVLSAEGGFWQKHPGMHERVATLFRQNSGVIERCMNRRELVKALRGLSSPLARSILAGQASPPTDSYRDSPKEKRAAALLPHSPPPGPLRGRG